MSKFFLVYKPDGPIRYSVEKIDDACVRATVYYETQEPDNIELNLSTNTLTEYEGTKRVIPETVVKSQAELKKEFAEIIKFFVAGKPITFENQSGSVTLAQATSELKDISLHLEK
ncbi:hypothetical protein H8D36_05390 [archaeon]|nr:hypothetical protein [archaeon]MBL7057339.1 hypothetical protein [Candidatus Woesearchaeota archaeon]